MAYRREIFIRVIHLELYNVKNELIFKPIGN